MTAPLSPAELAALPPALDVPTVARLLRISRTTAYDLAARDELPVAVLRIGRSYRVPTAPLLALLGLTQTPDTGGRRGDGAAADGPRPAPGEGPSGSREEPSPGA